MRPPKKNCRKRRNHKKGSSTYARKKSDTGQVAHPEKAVRKYQEGTPGLGKEEDPGA